MVSKGSLGDEGDKKGGFLSQVGKQETLNTEFLHTILKTYTDTKFCLTQAIERQLLSLPKLGCKMLFPQ